MNALADLAIALRFFSRFPVPATAREREAGASGLAGAVALVPLAGLVIGLAPALVLASGRALGLPSVLAAPLAVIALVAATGALHEDGLTDCADGFGGGRTRARKLEIMRDSRIGTYGACALALSLYVRAVALGLVAARGTGLGVSVLLAAAVLSRMACLLPLIALPPARGDGAGASAGRPEPRAVGIGLAVALVLACVVLAPSAAPARIALAVALACVAALAVCALAWRQIGGQTGDVAGATQQVTEIAIYLVFAAL